MIRKLVVLFCLFIHVIVLGQAKKDSITISFAKANVHDVIAILEKKTQYQFYYVDTWLGDLTVSGDYQNATLSKILDDIFEKTSLNYYITANEKVILTKNNIIYDQLPSQFFVSESDKKESNTTDSRGVDQLAPVFYGEEIEEDLAEIETIRVGKEIAGNVQQTYRLSGVVKNSKTDKPIPDLSLIVKNRRIGTSTDEKGYYELDLPAGINLLEARAIGVKSQKKRVIIYNNGELNFGLDEGIQLLDEVTVEADQRKNVEEEITGSTTINAEESKDIPLVLGERNILSIATKLPGITSAGEGATGFNVRGGKTDQNLILLDNAVIYNPTHFFGIFQALNPYVTKDLDIYKGNIPVEFGGRLSSVFDITTISGNTEKFSGEASIGPVTSNISVQIPIVKERASLVLGGRGAYSDWILQSLEDKKLRNSQASFYDFVANYSDKINENNDVKATAYFSSDAFSITSDSLYGYSNRSFSADWKHKFNDKNSGNLILANSKYSFDIAYDGPSNNDFDLGYSVDETELKLKFNFLPDSLHNISYGVSGKLYAVNPGFIKPNGPESTINNLLVPEERGFEGAIFIGDNYKISERLAISAGLRYSFFAALGASLQRQYEPNQPRNEATFTGTEAFDQNEVIKTYGGPEVRASLRYLFTPDFSIKASYNNMYQYIHTLSNTTTVSPIDTWKLSDANIKPQLANQYSVGLYKNFDDNNYEISLEGYYKNSSNLLDFKTGAQLLLNQQIETEVIQGNGRAYGLEFLIRKNRGKFNGWLGYTYSRSEIKFDGPFAEERINDGAYFPSNYDKPHDVSFVGNYKLTRRYSVSMNFEYQTGRPITYPVGQYNFNNGQYVYYSNRNEFRIPDYYRLDVGLNIEGNHKIKKFAHSFWNISVYNVLGRANPYSVFFVTEGGEVKAFKSSIFSIPIPSITYNFKF